MNVAVCFSGGIRYPHIGLESLKKIIPNNNVKIFIHTWKVYDRNLFLDTVHGLEYKEHDNTLNTHYSILESYDYETLLIENFDTIKPLFEQKFQSLKFSKYHRNDIGPMSMHYSIHKSNELKREYERQHNMIFDCVIRMRFDSDFQNKTLDLVNFNNGLFIPEGEDWNGGINDQFALGSSPTIDVYSDVINHLESLQSHSYHPETLLRKYLELKGISVQRFDFPVKINNNIDFRKVMFG
jgi:hypothetical protein